MNQEQEIESKLDEIEHYCGECLSPIYEYFMNNPLYCSKCNETYFKANDDPGTFISKEEMRQRKIERIHE